VGPDVGSGVGASVGFEYVMKKLPSVTLMALELTTAMPGRACTSRRTFSAKAALPRVKVCNKRLGNTSGGGCTVTVAEGCVAAKSTTTSD